MNPITSEPYQYQVTPGPCTAEELKKIQYHLDLLRDLAGGLDNDFNRVLKYCADMLQNSARNPGIALYFIGPSDSGMSTFWEDFFATLILGKTNYFSTCDIKGITGEFNTCVAGKTVVIADNAKINAMGFEGLERILTSPRYIVERKSEEPVEVKNNTRLIFLSTPETTQFVQNDTNRFHIFKYASELTVAIRIFGTVSIENMSLKNVLTYSLSICFLLTSLTSI